jgi:hypothetical protein
VKGHDNLEGSGNPEMAYPVGSQADDVSIFEKDLAMPGGIYASNNVEQSCFPGSVWADEAHNLGLFHRHVQIAEGHESTEILLEVFNFEKRHLGL